MSAACFPPDSRNLKAASGAWAWWAHQVYGSLRGAEPTEALTDLQPATVLQVLIVELADLACHPMVDDGLSPTARIMAVRSRLELTPHEVAAALCSAVIVALDEGQGDWGSRFVKTPALGRQSLQTDHLHVEELLYAATLIVGDLTSVRVPPHVRSDFFAGRFRRLGCVMPAVASTVADGDGDDQADDDEAVLRWAQA